MPHPPEPDGGTTTTAPPPIHTADVWVLHDRPDKLYAAAGAWRAFATASTTVADDVDRLATALYNGPWEGAAADSYDKHRKKLTADVDAAVAQANAIAGALESAAGALRAAQGHLTDEWAKVVAVPFSYDGSGNVTFRPTTPDQEKIVKTSIGVAHEIRRDLDTQLNTYVSEFPKTQAVWKQISSTWEQVALGNDDGFTLPPEANGTFVLYDGNRVIVNTGPGNDNVQVSVDPKTGEQVVTINGSVYHFPPGADVVIRAGEGNDSVTVAPGTRVKLTMIGGEGDDILRGADGHETILGLDGRDQVYAGAGNDRVSGGADRDYVDGQRGDDILSGGLGDDTVYGLGGNDRISGGEGQDYLEGGTGNDTIDAGAGNDIVSGGRDDDTMRGGGGNDVFYAGRGNDTIEGGSGNDRSFGEKNDTTSGVEQNVVIEIKDSAQFIKVEGSDDFKERIAADLDMLRSSPRGAQMMEALQHGHDDSKWSFLWFGNDGDTLTIREYNNPQDPNNSTASHSGGDHLININPHLDRLGTGAGNVEGPPVAVLYHEMAHVYDYMNDSLAPGDYHGNDPRNHGTPNREREAAGLPIDEDNNPNTPEQIYSKHPYELTENGLRDEMGAPHRDAY
jgi:Ca2+-binding RTX toxin-like protein